MKIIFLQDLTGGLFGGLLNGLLNGRFKGLLAKTPVLVVLFLAAIITACASGDSKSSNPPPKADCVFAEGAAAAVDGYTGCELFAFPQVPQVIDSDNIIYNVTTGVINKGSNDSFGDNNRFESAVSNFTFTQIINGNTSNPQIVGSININNQLTLSVNATALNITFRGIHADLFGEFYIELVLVDNDEASVKVRYTITITAVNDPPVFEAVRGSESQFMLANGAMPTHYSFADIPFNSFIGYSVGNVSASDAENNTVTYSIEDESIYPLFLINPMTGEITLRALADAEALYTFNVIASDNKGGITRTDITVSVLPDNQAPVFGVFSFAGIPHTSSAGYSVGNVSATDADGEAPMYTISREYNINGSSTVSNDLFQINLTTGEITLEREAAANDLGEYTFNVNASDGEGASTTAAISVTVIDATPPVFVGAPYSFNLFLSAANADGVVVGNVSAIDNERTLFDYSLVFRSDLFKLAAADNADGTRNIILSRAVTIDDLTESPVTLLVVAIHRGGRLSSAVSVITVNLINDLQLDDDFDADGVMGFYDASPHDEDVNVTGSGEPGDPYIISNIYQLQAIAGVDHTGTALDSSTFTNNTFLYGASAAEQLTKHYKLVNDINASDTNTDIWNKPEVTGYTGRGWTPIAGKNDQSFSGSFNGEGYAISNLNMSLRAAAITDSFGLFGTNNGNISAVGLENIEMRIQSVEDKLIFTTGEKSDPVTIPDVGNGGLVGKNEQAGVIQYAYVSGLVNATANKVGGLVGSNLGEISYSYSTAAVEGRLDTGGLVGSNTAGGKILSSYATGNVNGAHGYRDASSTAPYEAVVGSLVGYVSGDANNIVNASYATGSAIAEVYDIPTTTDEERYIGHLVGQLDRGEIITSSYWYNNSAITDIMGIGNGHASAGHTGLSNAQLQGCELDGAVISGVTSAPDCTGLFPSSHWAPNTDTAASIRREWIFRPGNYPSLSAFRTSGGTNKLLMPSLLEQQCHRRGNPLGRCSL